jgi:hypothetical protein
MKTIGDGKEENYANLTNDEDARNVSRELISAYFKKERKILRIFF